MYGRNPYYRHPDYCRNYYDDYCDYDHHYDFYRRAVRGRYYDNGPIEEASINANLYINKYK